MLCSLTSSGRIISYISATYCYNGPMSHDQYILADIMEIATTAPSLLILRPDMLRRQLTSERNVWAWVYSVARVKRSTST